MGVVNVTEGMKLLIQVLLIFRLAFSVHLTPGRDYGFDYLLPPDSKHLYQARFPRKGIQGRGEDLVRRLKLGTYLSKIVKHDDVLDVLTDITMMKGVEDSDKQKTISRIFDMLHKLDQQHEKTVSSEEYSLESLLRWFRSSEEEQESQEDSKSGK